MTTTYRKPRPPRVRRFLPALLGLLVAAACSDPAGPGPGPGADDDPIDELPRPLTIAEAMVIERSNAFGIDLMNGVVARDDRPNIVLSPLSASMALGMALNGAAGSTLEGMRAALRFGDLSREEINESYRGLIDLLVDLDPRVEMSIANSTWANEEYPFHSDFFETVALYFDAAAERRDFGAPGTLSEINGWVAERTNGRIESILEPGQLDPALALLLLNAVYFDAPWTTRFDPDDTVARPFTRVDGSTVEVDMMSLEGIQVLSGAGGEFRGVELPYGGGAFSMVVAIPTGSDPLRGAVAELDAAAWEGLLASLEPTELDRLSLPRFELSYDAFLNDPLAEMGMGEAFTTEADFSELSPAGLCIDFVRQKSFIRVDEAGTEAAAVTGVGIGPTSFNGFVVDRPFLFAIRERISGTILFVGTVSDPTATDSEPGGFPEPCRNR